MINEAVSKFQIFYQNIYDLYHESVNDEEKWWNIAKYMNREQEIAVNIFALTKKSKERTMIKYDYSLSLTQIHQSIADEKDLVVKTSQIVLAIHHILYDVMSLTGNYKFSLFGPEEMHVLQKDIIYYINISDKTERNILFHAFILLFGLESLFNSHLYVGIDFEYTQKMIQLAQLNFEHNIALQSFIHIVSPNELEPVMMTNFIQLIMCNKYVRKILHGSDSQDIPYVYNHMLQEDPKLIIKFNRALIDTRFLCEYYKLTRDDPSDNRCSIYDADPGRSAIYYFKLITVEQQQKLTDVLEAMPVDIIWNIHRMENAKILYAQYDVIFLKYFYYRIIFTATENETTELGKKSVIDLYKYVLNEITQFVYLERAKITFLMAKCKEEVDVVNNYFIRGKNSITKMIDVYNKVSVGLETTNPAVNIDKLTKVNHFKIPVLTIIKRIVYGHISRSCRVYKDKNTVWTDKMPNDFILEFLKEMKYQYLLNIFRELDRILESRVRLTCNNV